MIRNDMILILALVLAGFNGGSKKATELIYSFPGHYSMTKGLFIVK